MRQPLEHLSRIIGYDFADETLIETALTHRSAGNLNNERLEFLGDAILGFVIADELCRRFPGADEGQLSRLRAGLVKGEKLAKIARQAGLGAYLTLGAGESRSGGHARTSILSDALEAIFAAVYLDGGLEAARRVILNLFEKSLSLLSPDAQQKDPKTRLQELLQARGRPLPEYCVLEVSGSPHEQLFIVECRLEEPQLCMRGSGGSRRKAEQEAASLLVEQLTGGPPETPTPPGRGQG